ncbi:hypothetical protein AXG93_2956s1240 [Marchantia polymorpha subsp. ruderalis]|uniref:Uncharacterized protein n=1 Tax=Marchantia polymorpha subsp. ruderalis TaxID=1480154 RepID=A0A176WD20_MARPO|nr:hypothetical protein AXG93_2956s1240 [Marchantia polymorpha subsp. ruderalis]
MEMRSFGSFVSMRGRGSGDGARSVDRRGWRFRGVSLDEMEVRRAVSLRGGRWVAKAWMLLCVLVSTVFCFWALIGSSDVAGSRFLWLSPGERDIDVDGLKQLDEISLALLKLGLPLSAYAISMQNRAHSDSSNAGLLLAANAPPGFGIVDPSDGAARHPVHADRDERVAHSSEAEDGAQGWDGQVSPSEISIYSVASNYNYMQQLWVFGNVCYNGSHLIRLQNEVCKEPEDAAPQSPLTPIHCRNGDLYARRLAMVKETGLPMTERLPAWMNGRDSITWRNETVSLVNLDSRTMDPSRFLQKVNMLLLLNNASTSAFLDQIGTFMFMTHRRVAKILKDRADGEERFHKTYLSTILSRALPMDRTQVGDIFEGGLVADTRVELNDPFSAATEDRPLCFRKAVLTGTLKGSCWPGGEVVADMVRDHLSERKALGLDVHFKDYREVDFKEQFEILQLADVVVGFYGVDIIIPCLFSRKMLVLVEIVPYKVQDRAHETQALDSGLIYMAYQCEEGSVQDADSFFRNESASSCTLNPKCRQHYAAVRKVQLTTSDLAQLQKVVSLARLIAAEMSAQQLAKRKGRIHDASSFLVENLIGGKGKCVKCENTVPLSLSFGANKLDANGD